MAADGAVAAERGRLGGATAIAFMRSSTAAISTAPSLKQVFTVSSAGNLAMQTWQTAMVSVCFRQHECPHGKEVGKLAVTSRNSRHIAHSNDEAIGTLSHSVTRRKVLRVLGF